MSGPVVLAAAAAILFAAGNNLQRDAAAKVPAAGHGPVRLMARLVRSPRWLAGSLCAVGGLLCQASALRQGGVILVQAVIASTLVYSLMMEVALERRRPSSQQVVGAVAVVTGIVLLVGVGRPGAGGQLTSPWRSVPAWLAVALLGGGAMLRARLRPRGRRTAIMLGAAAGACFAVDAAFLRGLATAVEPFEPVMLTLNVAGFAAASAVGNLTIQRGFQLAPLRHVLPAMAATEPVAAFSCGWLLFGERLQAGPVGVTGVVGGLVLMVVGVLLCALQGPAARAVRSNAEPDRVPS
ncbi:MAG TPA: DMT family transporter [Kineosporiaceae bacterium]